MRYYVRLACAREGVYGPRYGPVEAVRLERGSVVVNDGNDAIAVASADPHRNGTWRPRPHSTLDLSELQRVATAVAMHRGYDDVLIEAEADAAAPDDYTNQCPACGSDEIDASDYDGDRCLTCRVTCADCGASWTEEYLYRGRYDYEEGDDSGEKEDE